MLTSSAIINNRPDVAIAIVIAVNFLVLHYQVGRNICFTVYSHTIEHGANPRSKRFGLVRISCFFHSLTILSSGAISRFGWEFIRYSNNKWRY